jgi:deoxyribodipyrimidine photo-lyase
MKINVVWLRRDLRLSDNAALYHALKSANPVLPIFIFDKNILDILEDRADARVTFLQDTVNDLRQKLDSMGSTFWAYYGTPLEAWQRLTEQFEIETVFTNRDYEPYASERDTQIRHFLKTKNIDFTDFKDHVIFDKQEVVKDDGLPYTVFTPYSRKWRAALTSRLDTYLQEQVSFYLKPYPTEGYHSNFIKTATLSDISIQPIPSLAEMGFQKSAIPIPSATVARGIVRHYAETRDFPALPQGTTRLGIHFRFGTISIREKALAAQSLSDTYLNELIWRDFYSMILQHFPRVGQGQAFRSEYERIVWLNDEKAFQAWCEGKTGYPIVDAGMRELNATGYMHNRVRMITSSFLTKHLLIDWRWGEAYFAKKLLDFDLASNNGGWQWAAGCGTDAAPYFRIFNPTEQQKKFDAQAEYIRRWVPEYLTPQYPKPIVDHKLARERCLKTYADALKGEQRTVNNE